MHVEEKHRDREVKMSGPDVEPAGRRLTQQNGGDLNGGDLEEL